MRLLQIVLALVIVGDAGCDISLVFVDEFSHNVGAQNSHIYVKSLARGFIMISAAVVGGLTIEELLKLKAPMFRRRVTERIIVIAGGILLQLVPFVIEICNTTLNPQIVLASIRACHNESVFFSFYLFVF